MLASRLNNDASQSFSVTLHNTEKDKVLRLKRTDFCHYAKCMALAVLIGAISFTVALAQKPSKTETDSKQAAPDSDSKESKDSKKAPKPGFILTVKNRPILNISLKADKANMNEVAQDLSKKLKTPVFLGQVRQNELVSIEFSELTFEPAMQLMSPTVYVDYEINMGSTDQPKPLGIYLFDLNQGEPPLSAVVNGSNQSLLIEGNTEDGVETESDSDKKEEEPPLKVFYQNYQLTVKAKKQPLSLVLLKIGEEIGIPVDLQDDGKVLVDADISKLPVEDAIRQLSPHVRLFVRADLTRAERRVLRMVLTGAPKTTQQTP